MTPLRAPFPWFGGKSRIAQLVWSRFGNPGVYAEPFAGSLAVLLARPHGAGPREIVCDIDGGLCNAWRALQHDPEEVAFWADYPTIHQDLTARHRYLVRWIHENSERLSSDEHFYDPKVAGWWLWGISLWIGGGWCAIDRDIIPHVKFVSGQGVSAQRTGLDVADKRPLVGGQGVSAQRTGLDNPPGEPVQPQDPSPDRPKPSVCDSCGRGMSTLRPTRPALISWFAALQERLFRVVVLNRSWQSALTPTLLAQTRAPKPDVAVFLDPPYRTDDRSSTLYGSDIAGDSDDVAVASYEWAVEHGEKFRVAYCMHEGDFPVPAGWETHTMTFGGINDPERQSRRDLVMFSPACLGDPQGALF